MYGYCQENIDVGHYWDLKGLKEALDLSKMHIYSKKPHIINLLTFLTHANFSLFVQVILCISLLWNVPLKPRFWCIFRRMLNGILLMRMLSVW